MNPKITHPVYRTKPEKPFIAKRGGKFFGNLTQNPILRAFLIRSLFALTPLIVTGCASHADKPVIVQVQEAPTNGGRFRAPERQRDVWIAPQAVDNEVLRHEQIVTFVEKPVSWQLPSTIEPNTVSKPDLPLEEGDYDAEVIRRQKEMIEANQGEIKKLSQATEQLKTQLDQKVGEKENQLKQAETSLQSAEQDLNAAKQRLADIEAAEQKKKQEEEQRKAKKWWQKWGFWK